MISEVLGAMNGRPSGQDFVKDRTQTVNVGPLVDQIVATLGLLGGHVCRRSQELALHGPVGTGTGLGIGPAAGAYAELRILWALPFAAWARMMIGTSV